MSDEYIIADYQEESPAQASLTAAVRAYLEEQIDDNMQPLLLAGDTDSIYQHSSAEGLTLQEYVRRNPQKAIQEAEASLNEWLKLQTMAAVEGFVETSLGKYAVNKNMTTLLQRRVELAQNQLDTVNEYVYTASLNGEARKNHLIRVAYKKAVEKGDTRMLMYLMDRVDGRPGETKVADLDYDNAFNVYQIIHTLFDKQLEVLNSGAGTKMVCCSRRSGKTRLFVAAVLIEALRVPNTTCLYIGETMEQTEFLVEQAVNEIVDKCKLRDKRGKRLNWRRLDNGSKIIVRGLSNTKDPDLIRGNKAKVIVIDEFFHLKGELLNYLVQEVLQPMQMDYASEYLFLCGGTPPSIKNTYGEHAWRTWEVPHWTWTYKDNPHPVDVTLREQYVNNILKEKGLTWDTPWARREYGGEWIYDEDLLLFPEFGTYNPREAIPAFNIDLVLFGIDYGVGDNDTLIGVAWDNSAMRGYIFHEDKFNRLDIKDRTISQLQYLESCVREAWQQALDFFPTLEPREANKRILWSADDNDQHVTDHLNINCRIKDLKLQIQNAHKTETIMMHDKMRDLLRKRDLLLIEGGPTAKECESTVLQRAPNGQIKPDIDMKVYHPDCIPALRYALWDVLGVGAK